MWYGIVAPPTQPKCWVTSSIVCVSCALGMHVVKSNLGRLRRLLVLLAASPRLPPVPLRCILGFRPVRRRHAVDFTLLLSRFLFNLCEAENSLLEILSDAGNLEIPKSIWFYHRYLTLISM